MRVTPCLCANTRLAGRAITRLYEAELRAAGLLAPQFWLLCTISESGRINQVSLNDGMGMDQTTLSRNLKVLIKHGWVAGEAKGRERFYSLTAEGKEVLKRAQPYWQRAQQKMQQALGADWEHVWQMLSRLATAAESAFESKPG